MLADVPMAPATRRSIVALLHAQFLGAFNDHLFKMIVSLIAITAAIEAGAGSAYLSIVTAIYISPYILFSGYAGYLADRYDKSRVLLVVKLAEVAVMVVALVALLTSSIWFLIIALFLMGSQSAFFSPAKYGILPDLLPASALPRANALLESALYVAVILGTVTGGVLLAVWGDRPLFMGMVLVAIAVAGALAAKRIGPGAGHPTAARLRLNPWAEVGAGIRCLAGDRALIWVVAGLSYFSFAATLMMLDSLLIAKSVMGLDDLRVGLLGAAAGMGMGLGCILAGRLSRHRVELRLVPVGMLGNSLAVLAMAGSSGSFGLTALLLSAASAFGGLFLVPLYALLQIRAPAHEKGRVIATSNFFSMSALLAASIALWLFVDLLNVTPQTMLAALGIFGTTLVLVVSWCLPDLWWPPISEVIP